MPAEVGRVATPESLRRFQHVTLDHRIVNGCTDDSAKIPLAPSSCHSNLIRSTGPSFHRHSSSLFSSVALRCLLLLLLATLRPCDAIRCYCTDDHCVPAYGVCESSVCLVGLRRPDLTVIRTCGEEPLGCQRNVDNWVDLCACDKPFCNTFSYLRESTQNADQAAVPFPPHSPAHDSQMPLGRRGDEFGGGGIRSASHQMLTDEDTRVFQRVDGPPGEYIDEHGVRHRAPLSTRSSLLTMLIVIVPVSVFAATILVISFNYYCHLC